MHYPARHHCEVRDEVYAKHQKNGQIKKINRAFDFLNTRYTNLFGSRFRRDGSDSYAI